MIQENADFSHKLTACFGDIADFEQKIRQLAEIAKIELNLFEIDHLAVRMNTLEMAQEWKKMLLSGGQILKESEVNGRPICLLRLNQPLYFCGQMLWIIELPFPKNKIYPEEGWEHIEIVVPMLPNENVDEWVARCCERWDLRENPHLKLKISQPIVVGERLPNPSIAITLSDKLLGNLSCIKLHPYSLERICQES